MHACTGARGRRWARNKLYSDPVVLGYWRYIFEDRRARLFDQHAAGRVPRVPARRRTHAANAREDRSQEGDQVVGGFCASVRCSSLIPPDQLSHASASLGYYWEVTDDVTGPGRRAGQAQRK
jgi:hypothetical protein